MQTIFSIRESRLYDVKRITLNKCLCRIQETLGTFDPLRWYVFMCKNVVDNRQIFPFHSMLRHFICLFSSHCKHSWCESFNTFDVYHSLRINDSSIWFEHFSFVSALMGMHNYWGLFQSTDEHLSVAIKKTTTHRSCTPRTRSACISTVSAIIANEEWKQYKFKTVQKTKYEQELSEIYWGKALTRLSLRILTECVCVCARVCCCCWILFRIWTVRWNVCLL